MIAKMPWPLIQVSLPLMFYINEIPISSQWYKKGFMIFFYCDVTAFHQVPLTPSLFSVTQHHEKRWDPSTPYAWRNYWTAPEG